MFFIFNWFAFLLFMKYVISELSITIEEERPSIDTELFMETIIPNDNSFNCYYINIHNKCERVISSVYQVQSISLVIGDAIFSVMCKQYIFIVENDGDIEELKLILNSDYNRIIVLIITLKYPENKFWNMNNFTTQIKILHVPMNSLETLMKVNYVNVYSKHALKLPDYMGRLLRIGTFNCPVYSYGIKEGMRSSSNAIDELDGIEMKIFLEVSKRLNFTWKIEEPQELNKWGQKFKNGTWSGGIVGALVEKVVDIGFCCLWLTIPQSEDIDLTLPWGIHCNTLLVPRPRRLQKLGALFYPFTKSVWILFIAAIFFVSTTLWCLEKTRHEIIPGMKVLCLDRIIQDLIGILTMGNTSSPYIQIHESRHVSTWWAVFVLLMTTAYSSTLVSHLTVPLFDSPLNSVRDLVMADIHWSQSYFPAVDVMFNLENPWHRKYIRKFQLDPGREKFHHPFQAKDHASLGSVLEGDRPYFIEPVPMNPKFLSFLRVMKECVSRYYISIGLTKNSPYTSGVNEVISRLIESGIIKNWQSDVIIRRSSSQMTHVFEETDRKLSGPEVLKVQNLQGAFLLLLCGLCFGSLMFLFEKFIVKLGRIYSYLYCLKQN
ncbi:Ionotropic receptor 105 [Blattella germanica]|nr:Ionotropic receptor 105 [Blattella germanica]